MEHSTCRCATVAMPWADLSPGCRDGAMAWSAAGSQWLQGPSQADVHLQPNHWAAAALTDGRPVHPATACGGHQMRPDSEPQLLACVSRPHSDCTGLRSKGTEPTAWMLDNSRGACDVLERLGAARAPRACEATSPFFFAITPTLPLG